MKIKDIIPWLVKRRFLFLVLLMVISGASAWTYVPLEEGFTTSLHSLDIKSNGDVCFLQNSTLGLIYECCSATVTDCYDFSVVEGPTAYKGDTAVLDIDASGDPHVAYIDTSGLCYWDGTTSELLDANVDRLGNIETDGNNRPHIAYKYGTFPDQDAKELYYYSGAWFTIDYGPRTEETPILHTDQYGDIVYFATIIYDGGDTFGSIRVYNHSSDSSTYSTYYNFYTNSHAFRGENITDFYYREDSAEFYFGIYDDEANLDGIFNATYGNESITRSLTTDAWYSFPQRQTVPIYYGYEEGAAYKIGDVGSYVGISELSNIADDFATYRISPIEYEYVLFTHTDGTVYIAYDVPTVIIEGDVLDFEDSDPIPATLCYNAYCDVTNTTGGYSVTLPAGTYDVTITGMFGYDDYADDNLIFTETTSGVDYYLPNEDYIDAENISDVTLTFMDFDTLLPHAGQTFRFYYSCGCPGLVGSTFYYTSNSLGQIDRQFVKGDYDISAVNGDLFWSAYDSMFKDKVVLTISGDDHAEMFKLREIEGNYSYAGYVLDNDDPTNKPIANATIYLTGLHYSFSTTSNETGYFIIEDLAASIYNVVVSADGYETKAKADTLDVPCPVECWDYFLLVNSTPTGYFVNGTVISIDDDTGIGGVVLTFIPRGADFGGTIRSTTTAADGSYLIGNLTAGNYGIRAVLTGYSLYCYTDPMIGETCYTISGVTSLYFEMRGGTDYIDYDILMVNNSAIIYYSIEGNVTGEGTPLKNAIVKITPGFSSEEEGYFALKTAFTNASGYYYLDGLREDKKFYISVIKDGYTSQNAIFYATENLTQHYDLNEADEVTTLSFYFKDCSQDIYNLPVLLSFYNDSNYSNLIYDFIVEGSLTGKDILAGYYYITVTALDSDAYETRYITANLTGIMEIRDCLTARVNFHSLKIFFKDKDSTEVYTGLDISLTKDGDGFTARYNEVTDNEGKIDVDLPPGEYSVTPSGLFNYFDPVFQKYKSFPFIADITLSNKEYIINLIPLNSSINPKTQAEFEIKDFLYTYTPSLLFLFVILFVFSAIGKLKSPAGDRY